MVYGNMGHGVSWKKCCLEVGALPIRCYSRERAKYYQDKHEKEKQNYLLLINIQLAVTSYILNLERVKSLKLLGQIIHAMPLLHLRIWRIRSFH